MSYLLEYWRVSPHGKARISECRRYLVSLIPYTLGSLSNYPSVFRRVLIIKDEMGRKDGRWGGGWEARR